MGAVQEKLAGLAQELSGRGDLHGRGKIDDERGCVSVIRLDFVLNGNVSGQFPYHWAPTFLTLDNCGYLD
ncbi:hypothetical protein NECAME_18026 [Necator americanus]|uniref:Uncharacterized protein n=1 Tax=Necator americanus TaxID=51031 RepID=W2TH46_NECAM|nr:hypothetical protein NECAME_18026 [Necator americanus]ETN80322.1 hypothetical protein NECAME_18026 [Necator americanus]